MRALGRSLRSIKIGNAEMRGDRQEVGSGQAKTDDYAVESCRAEESTHVELRGWAKWGGPLARPSEIVMLR